MQKTKKLNWLSILIVISIIFLNALGPYFKLEKLTTTVLLPSLGIIALRNDLATLNQRNNEFLVFILIFILSILSVYYYISESSLTRAFSVLTGTLISAYIPTALNKNKNYAFYFHIGFIISIILLIYIMYINNNINFGGFSQNVGRRDRFMLNANFYSYISYFANMSLFFIYLKRKSLIIKISLAILPIIFIMVSFTTQSRSGILFILFINLIFWTVINVNKSKSKLSKIFLLFSKVILLVFLLIQFFNIYSNSQIKNRVSNTKVDAREILVIEAIEVYKNNPFLGVGLGQFPYYNKYRLFSHNSYTEIASESGTIGLFLFLALLIIPLYKSIKFLNKNRKDPEARLIFLFFFTFIFYNNAYVFYKATYAMMFFFLIISILNKKIHHQNNTISIDNSVY